MHASTLHRYRGAIAHARTASLQHAREEVLRARSEDAESPEAALIAGALLFVTRDYHLALQQFDRAFSLGAGPTALWRKYQLALNLGWEQDARTTLEQGHALAPDDARWLGALLGLYARRRDYASALRFGTAYLAREPNAYRGWIEVATAHVARGEKNEAKEKLRAAQQATLPIEAQLELARLYRALGEFSQSQSLLQPLLQTDLRDEARSMQIEFALWNGACDQARALLTKTLPHATTQRFLGVIALLEGQRKKAKQHFEETLRANSDDAEAHAWMGELLPEEDRFDEAGHHLTKAVMNARGQLYIAHLLRIRSNVRAKATPHTLSRSETDHLLAPLLERCPDLSEGLQKRIPAVWCAAIDRCLVWLRGNRSVHLTWMRNGALELVPVGPEPRAEARRVLERIRVGKREELLAELEALAVQFPNSGLPHAHRGELLLWYGDVPAARQALMRATEIMIGTRWAHIGLTMCDVLEEQYEEALLTSSYGVWTMRNTEGPAVFVHRGEALRKLGRLEEARTDLERSVAMHPSRVGAWINLGLLHLSQNHPEGARNAIEQVFSYAPGLLSDAAREENVTLFYTRKHLNEQVFGRVLERALRMLQGNRSSSGVSYQTQEGLLRFGFQGQQAPPSLQPTETSLLAAAESLLQKASR